MTLLMQLFQRATRGLTAYHHPHLNMWRITVFETLRNQRVIYGGGGGVLQPD